MRRLLNKAMVFASLLTIAMLITIMEKMNVVIGSADFWTVIGVLIVLLVISLYFAREVYYDLTQTTETDEVTVTCVEYLSAPIGFHVYQYTCIETEEFEVPIDLPGYVAVEPGQKLTIFRTVRKGECIECTV